MTTDRLRIDYAEQPDFIEALQYVSGKEIVPFEKTPRFVSRSVKRFYEEANKKAKKSGSQQITFTDAAELAIARSRAYEQAWIGQQLTRTLEPVIFQGLSANILHKFQYEPIAMGIGGYILGIPNEPHGMQRFKVLAALSETFYLFLQDNLGKNRSSLRRNMKMDDINGYLMDNNDYDPYTHVYLDIVFGKFAGELRDLEAGNAQCDIFRKTRRNKVEEHFTEDAIAYDVDPQLQTIRQQYSRFRYAGPSYDSVYLDLPYSQRQHMQLLSRLPIMGMPILRAEADLYDEMSLLPRSRFSIPDHPIIPPDLLGKINEAKNGEGFFFE